MTSSPNFSTLEVATNASLGALCLNRPSRLNALSLELLEEITEAAAWFNTQDEIRSVIIAGNGKAFCAGADLAGFPQVGDANVRAAADSGRIMADAVESMRAVTIAKIHGWCVGGGLVLAAACDLRVATDATKFSIPEIDLGIPLAWGGIARLVREIGPAMTKELVMTCRQFSSAEAKSLGFLNRVVTEPELQQTAQDLADQICAKPRHPIASTKQHVNAVSAQMGATLNAWSDADGLLVGLLDSECQSAREAYIKKVTNK
ncbi:MAG: enoyl-CoA hydratase/carnithine racemase [Cryomorphaceae bacterium]|jgi:enoyl-CoA hydratase/carnithine racemase